MSTESLTSLSNTASIHHCAACKCKEKQLSTISSINSICCCNNIVTRFTNVRIIRNHQLIKEDLWVQHGKVTKQQNNKKQNK
jgi:hypothetical protein